MVLQSALVSQSFSPDEQGSEEFKRYRMTSFQIYIRQEDAKIVIVTYLHKFVHHQHSPFCTHTGSLVDYSELRHSQHSCDSHSFHMDLNGKRDRDRIEHIFKCYS